MLIAFLLIAAISFGGLALTYLIADDEPFMWRLSAGCVIGSAVCGTVGFAIASLFGLNTATAFAGILVGLLPLILFYQNTFRKRFLHDWAKAKGKLQGASVPKFLRFCYYAFFLILFLAFFSRAMIEMPQGIFTGGSQNLGDLPFHLGAILGFTDGNNFPPENPSFAGARFSYPFVADFFTATFMKLGAGVREAMFVQNVAWAFSLVVILERFVLKLTGNRLAGRVAPFLLFFSGGLGFFGFFTDYWAQTKSIFDFLQNLPIDYTIGSDRFRWGNSMVVMLITQRSLLLGMPLTLVVLRRLWEVFTTETQRHREEAKELSTFHIPLSAVLAGLIAGLLPLVHLHSLAVLFVVGVLLFILRPDRWIDWIAFAAGVAVIAVPELAWSLAGSASETSKFIGWHFGWSKGEENFFWFWFINTGLFIPLLGFGLWLVYSTRRRGDTEKKETKTKPKKHEDSFLVPHPLSLLLFYLPFAFLFLLSNVAKLAPWEWDNIKVLIYWFVGSIPFVAFAVAWVWERKGWFKAIAAVCIVVLIMSGALDVWRVASGQINYKVFDRDAVTIAERIKQQTDPHALFLNAPIYNSAVVLTGRRSLMRYTGHLFSHGIDYGEREADVKQIYLGSPAADQLLAKYNIDYVLISPEERNSLSANENYFRKFPIVAEVGQYRVYKVK
jgi:hypothetical protein